ncbi:MAG TPA: hypothetical protein VMQ45_00575 [Burkholderiaceae bacterium]|nr:hypothetical protein [Burkholderiaceae bacterium]
MNVDDALSASVLGAGIAEFDSVSLAPRAQRCARFGLLELVPLLEHASIGEEDLQAAVRALAPEERRDFLGICGQSLLNESLDESNAEISSFLPGTARYPIVEGASDSDELECVHQLVEFDGDSRGSPPVDACGLASDPDDTAAARWSLWLGPDALR